MSESAEGEDTAVNQLLSSLSADEDTTTASSDDAGVMTADVSAGADEADATSSEAVDYSAMTVAELKDLAKARGLSGYSTMTKSELIALLESSD